MGRRQVQGCAGCNERARAWQHRQCVTPARQTGAHECSRPPRGNDRNTWMQSSPSLARSRGVCFEHSTFSPPEECRSLLYTQLMFLKREKDPTTKLFDDNDLIRPLTETQEITADIPEESGTHDQQAVDPQTSPSHSDERILSEIRLKTTLCTRRR